MCGRFTRRSTIEELAEEFETEIVEEQRSDPLFAPSGDCRPGSLQPVLRLSAGGERELVLMRWGFNLPIQGRMKLVFNTKSEGVGESRLWRPRFERQRCIVPASSFFEWPGKVRTEIALRGNRILGFAGLWDLWKNPKTGEAEPTFSIFTSEPNALMEKIHNRQPVILDPREYAEWIERAERPPAHLLRVFEAEKTVVTPAENVSPGLFDSPHPE